jgi:transcriptional regulator with PAS, ATPase and Fis domain
MMTFLSKLLDLLKREIPCQRIEILLMDGNQKVIFRHSPKPSSARNERFILELVKRAVWQKNPVMIDEARVERFSAEGMPGFQEKVSAICVPLFLGDAASGGLYLERKNNCSSFSERNLKFLLLFINPINKILENCMNLRLFEEEVPEETGSLFMGKSSDFRRILALINKVKDRDAPVFICGESGTGKELVARDIHQRGSRRKGQFVAVNCGAIPDLLLESELFGYVKGAFTGALRDRLGLIEEADGGTFFLDEICDLSLHLQAKLLRLLQEREIRRIGENRTRRVNVRFISATNKDIEAQIEKGKFREDLYYRIKIITIELSPLRRKKEDLLFLLDHFLEKYCREMKRERAYFSPPALERLLSYTWPGNVRELQSEIQRCLIFSGDDILIKEECLSPRVNPQREGCDTSPYHFAQAKAEFEKRFLNQALARWNYNKTKTAEAIGLSRQGLFKLIKRHNLSLLKEK